jgi:hypothetical protein
MSIEQHRVRVWIFEVYPSDFGIVTVWAITESGERVRLTDEFYLVSTSQANKTTLNTS